jgi:hypothetical protein
MTKRVYIEKGKVLLDLDCDLSWWKVELSKSKLKNLTDRHKGKEPGNSEYIIGWMEGKVDALKQLRRKIWRTKGRTV